ncbi:MAG: DUF4878 domain-containing protein [Bacteroidota bacterium]
MKKYFYPALLILTILFTSCQESPEDVVIKFYRSVEAGNISAAKECLSERLLALAGEKLTVGLSKQTEEMTSCGGIKNIQVDLEGTGESRKGKATVSYSGDCPDETEDKLTLVKEEGKWKIGLRK